MKRIESTKLKEVFNRGYLLNSDSSLLYDVCEMVFSIHFSYRHDCKNDLIQEGILGLARLISENNFDEDKGDILTYAYSRVRNCMSNYLYYEKRERRQEVIQRDTDIAKSSVEDRVRIGNIDQDTGWPGFISEEFVEDIYKFVEASLGGHGIEGALFEIIKVYFSDKLGIQHEWFSYMDFSLDFVEKYRYYINLLEYEIFIRFINSNVFENNIQDILDVLEAEGEVSFYMRMFLDSLTKEQQIKLLYVYAQKGFRFPSKYKLLKVDTYLSIYKRVKHTALSKDAAARLFNKSDLTVDRVVNKYDVIFS